VGGLQAVVDNQDKIRALAPVTSVMVFLPPFAEMCSGSEAGSYLRLIDFCITQL